MTLVELMISASIFTFAVAGYVASSVLFVQIARDHENRADFASDMRSGMEIMSFDVRNTDDVTARTDVSFSLSFPSSASVTYAFDKNTNTITRTQGGRARALFRNVSAFDVLTSESDEPSGSSLSYHENEISIETLSFSASRGSAGPSQISITNFTLSMRNK